MLELRSLVSDVFYQVTQYNTFHSCQSPHTGHTQQPESFILSLAHFSQVLQKYTVNILTQFTFNYFTDVIKIIGHRQHSVESILLSYMT